MSLKECIRARTLASRPALGAAVHVPYRRSKLTLLMKDVFDIGCARLCSTVVLAHVSPTARDVKHSLSTLGYAAPLRVAVHRAPAGMERDLHDPALWDNAQARARARVRVLFWRDPRMRLESSQVMRACTLAVALTRTSGLMRQRRCTPSGAGPCAVGRCSVISAVRLRCCAACDQISAY
jgi:hypothetical protein